MPESWRKGVPFPSEGDQEAGSHSKCPSFSNGWDGPRRRDYCQVCLEILYFEKGKVMFLCNNWER